jgi:hypothetical protein
VCLVQERFETLAREQLAAIESAHPGASGRISCVRGETSPIPGWGWKTRPRALCATS